MNKAGIKKFFRFCRERHGIYLKKEAGLARPLWTSDKILQQYKFTNVFRELDRTTAWFSRYVRQPLRDKPEVMLATVLFRMFNRIEVGEALFCQTTMTDDGDVHTAFEKYLIDGYLPHLRRAIVAHVGKKGPYATGAYIISSPPGFGKLDGILRIVDGFAKRSCARPHCGYEDWMCAAKRLIEDPKTQVMEHTWDWLRGFDYLGNFHSYEVVCDLRHTRLLADAPDKLTWCSPGPGARRGMNRVLRRDKDERMPVDDLITLICALLSNARDREWWPQPHGEEKLAYGDYQVYAHDLRPLQSQWPPWEAREVEHSLCEFDKYERVRKGEGRPRSVYR